jgi:hypothetical protein
MIRAWAGIVRVQWISPSSGATNRLGFLPPPSKLFLGSLNLSSPVVPRLSPPTVTSTDKMVKEESYSE